VRFVVIDVIPALLSWEGRDRSDGPIVAPEADLAIPHLHAHHRLVALADAGISRLDLALALDTEGLARFFDSIATTAGLGPTLTPRIVRRMIHSHDGGPIVVTGRPGLARSLSRSRFGVVLTTQEEFGAVPDAVASLVSGRVSP
jgi:hypothetical protein